MRAESVSCNSGLGRQRWLSLLVELSQGGPYVLLVHTLPDMLKDTLRRLQRMTRLAGPSVERPQPSRRIA